MRATTTLLLDRNVIEKLKRHGVNLSKEVDGFLAARLAEVEGSEAPAEKADYEDLKRKQIKLAHDSQKLKAWLMRQQVDGNNAYNLLNRRIFEVGLADDFGNLGKVAPKFLNAWTGPEDLAHQFITLVEMVREKLQVENQLRKIRASLSAS
jgi:hypothetical protein